MKRLIFSLGILTAAAMFIFGSISLAEEQAGSEEMVQCAYDGMKGPKSAMKDQMEYQDQTYYFCTEEEREKFAQEPEKYLKMHGGTEDHGGHEGEHQGEHEGSHEGMEEQGSMMEGMGMGSGSGHGGMHGGSGQRHGH
jgi:YHS domain-containing protein